MRLQLGLCPRTRGWGAYTALDLREPRNGMGGKREEGMQKEGMGKGKNGMGNMGRERIEEDRSKGRKGGKQGKVLPAHLEASAAYGGT